MSMLKTDFANQFNRINNKGSNSLAKAFTIVFTLTSISVFLILIFPSNNILKIYHNPSSPSTYRAFLKEYLNIFEKYPTTYSLPKVYEESLKQAAKNALVLSSESKVYYPNNEALIKLTTQIENEIGNKFPELIAQK